MLPREQKLQQPQLLNKSKKPSVDGLLSRLQPQFELQPIATDRCNRPFGSGLLTLP